MKKKLTLAALGVCPRCSYGFLGRKPDQYGNMIDLDPSDPEYDPTKPCPKCKMVQFDVKKDEVKENKNIEGFGERHYIVYQPTDGDIETIGGPIYDKSDAEDLRELLIRKIKNSTYFKDVEVGERGLSPEYVEEEVSVVSSSSHPSLVKEIENEGDAGFGSYVMRPSQQFKKIEEQDKRWKDKQLEKLEERKTKGPNIAKSLKKIKIAQRSIKAALGVCSRYSYAGYVNDSEESLKEYCADLFSELYEKYVSKGYEHTDATAAAQREVDKYYNEYLPFANQDSWTSREEVMAEECYDPMAKFFDPDEIGDIDATDIIKYEEGKRKGKKRYK
jgi:hypothetical protein